MIGLASLISTGLMAERCCFDAGRSDRGGVLLVNFDLLLLFLWLLLSSESSSPANAASSTESSSEILSTLDRERARFRFFFLDFFDLRFFFRCCSR